MQGKLLHVVGGGYNQVPLVVTAKSLGLKVLVTDMFENAPCRALADFYEQIDTTDKYATCQTAKKYKIDAIVTDQTDAAVPTVAFIAEAMGLPGIGYETALRFTNKFLMREALKSKLPASIPPYHFFSTPAEAIEFCGNCLALDDLIVKPINSQGSKGVYKMNASNYREVISSAFLESKSRGLLIEKFLRGFEFSVEAFKDDASVHNMAVTKKYHYNSNDCIDERNTYLADVSPELENALFEINQKVISALELPFGITHAEYKVSGGVPYLIEIAARGGGGSISSKIVPFLTDFEPAKALLFKIFDQPFEISIQDYKKKFAILKFFNFKPGKVKKLHWSEAAVRGLAEFNLDIKEGDRIKAVKDSRDRPGYFVVCGTDRDEVIAKEKQVEASVLIEYEN